MKVPSLNATREIKVHAICSGWRKFPQDVAVSYAHVSGGMGCVNGYKELVKGALCTCVLVKPPVTQC